MRVAIVAQATTRASLEALLACLHSLDVLFLRTQLGVPPLYKSGVRYQAEPPLRGEERWLTIPEVIRQGTGDCDDLACWRAAELVASQLDEDARPEIVRAGPHVWHVIVRRGDGSSEDPSAVLGMRVPATRPEVPV